MHNLLLRSLFASALLAGPLCHAADGTPDPTFGHGGVAYLSPNGVDSHVLRTAAVIALPDGKLLFGGSSNKLIPGNADPNMRPMLARMNADGTPDTSFGSDPSAPGILVLPSISPTAIQRIEAMRRLADGSIIVAGSAFVFGPLTGFVAKFDADGHPATDFGSKGMITVAKTYLHALAIDSHNQIIIAGDRTISGHSSGFIGRLHADGSFDPSFGSTLDGTVLLQPAVAGDNSYVASIVLDGDAVIAGGYYEIAADDTSEFSLARVNADGYLVHSFAGSGWRVFHAAGDTSTFNGIDALTLTPDGIVIVAHHDDGNGGTGIVLGRIDAHGNDDASFGIAGYRTLDVAPSASARYATALLRQDDGKLLASITYATPNKQKFLLARTSADGLPDATFGTNGLVDLDVAPDGVYSDSTALTLQDGKPIIAGAAKRSDSSTLVDIAAVRLQNRSDEDTIFTDGFDDSHTPVTPVSNYDDLTESYLGVSRHYNGVTYRDANGIDGVFPDGSTFTAADVGDRFIVENAAILWEDFPNFGSTPNVLTFGTTYVIGPNFSVGAMVRATMDLDHPSNAASMDIAYYENGPWGGIVLHLDAYRNGTPVGSQQLTISDLGGRDNLTTSTLSISGVEFNSLRLYATWNGQPTAPRVMIDNLTLSSTQP